MGLQMTLYKEQNHMYIDFVDAYWSIEELGYNTEICYFRLTAYPSREAKKMNLVPITDKSLPIGSSSRPVCETILYLWEGIFSIVDIFPDGIPLSSDAQKTAVYNFIKEYTELPFEDVFED